MTTKRSGKKKKIKGQSEKVQGCFRKKVAKTGKKESGYGENTHSRAQDHQLKILIS